MNPENRKRLEAAIDFLREQDAGCLGDGERVERDINGDEALMVWSIRDELVNNLCKVLNGDSWRKIDPEDETTWPRYVASVWLFQKGLGVEVHYFWFPRLAKRYTHWKPAHIPAPPEKSP